MILTMVLALASGCGPADGEMARMAEDCMRESRKTLEQGLPARSLAWQDLAIEFLDSILRRKEGSDLEFQYFRLLFEDYFQRWP